MCYPLVEKTLLLFLDLCISKDDQTKKSELASLNTSVPNRIFRQHLPYLVFNFFDVISN